MNVCNLTLAPNHQAVLERFAAGCRADERILAAFVGSSYASNAVDQLSDLYVITTDQAFQAVYAQREAFLQQFGPIVFAENFDLPDIVFFVFADDTEGELKFGRESEFMQMHSGPYIVLLDKPQLLTGVHFPSRTADVAKQTELLRRLICWFWHDLSHVITALGRGPLWWALGQLEALRRYCVSLARLHHDFGDADAGDDVYFKLEQVLPAEQLVP